MLIVFASSFRILVTFAIVLEVRGISFFQIPRSLWQKFLNQKITTRVLSMSSTFYIVTLPVLPLCMGYPEETCWTLLDILIYASTTQKVICSFELSLFSYFPALVYQLIVKSMCAIVLIDAYYSCGPSSHSILEWLGGTNSGTLSISWIGSKQLYSADQMPTQLLIMFYPEVLPSYSRMSWELHHLLWILDAVILLATIIHFLVPCCCNRNADKWTMMCEINTPSNRVAW